MKFEVVARGNSEEQSWQEKGQRGGHDRPDREAKKVAALWGWQGIGRGRGFRRALGRHLTDCCLMDGIGQIHLTAVRLSLNIDNKLTYLKYFRGMHRLDFDSQGGAKPERAVRVSMRDGMPALLLCIDHVVCDGLRTSVGTRAYIFWRLFRKILLRCCAVGGVPAGILPG